MVSITRMMQPPDHATAAMLEKAAVQAVQMICRAALACSTSAHLLVTGAYADPTGRSASHRM